MKKIASSLVCLLLLAATLSAATISSPAATVQLTKKEVITVTQLNQEVQLYKQNGYSDIQPKEVLDLMINDILVNQGAARDGYEITETELDNLLAQYKTNVESQAGRAITDEEFQKVVEQNYGSMETFRSLVKSENTLQKYVAAVKGDILKDVAVPTESDIKTWYRQNTNNEPIAEPEAVRLSVIAKAKTCDATKDAATVKTLEGACKAMLNGSLEFTKAVQLYSEDTASATTGGDWGYLTDSEASRKNMGDEFVDSCMELEMGEFLGVLETPTFYAVVLCTEHRDAKILGLDDTIDSFGITVREYITAGLNYQNSQYAYLAATEALVTDLREQAKINIIYK